MNWLIWSNQHQGWWAPLELGYVKERDKAGRFTIERATEICVKTNCCLLGESPNEAMCPDWDAPRKDEE